MPSSNNRQPARRALVLWPWFLVIAAWVITLLATVGKQSALLDHHYLIEESGLHWLATLALLLIGWQVMVIAMMLPSSMPVLYTLTHTSRQQRHPLLIQTAFLLGYATIWTAFALVAFLGDTQIHHVVHRWPWLHEHPGFIGAATLALAGSFQFSPLKRYCLNQCRSPFCFFGGYYRKGIGPAWHLGLRHGIFCLGHCWALMLVMFGIGMQSLLWMVGLTGVMAIENVVPGGHRLSPFIGIALLLLAGLWFLSPN